MDEGAVVAGGEMSEKERARIKAEELYRQEVRRELSKSSSVGWMMEKLFFPALLLILTAGLTSLVVPLLQRGHHEAALRLQLLDDLLQNSTQMESAVRLFNNEAFSYWDSALSRHFEFMKVTLEKDGGRVTDEDAKERRADLDRQAAMFDKHYNDAISSYNEALESFRSWSRLASMRLVHHYGEEAEIQRMFGNLVGVFEAEDDRVAGLVAAHETAHKERGERFGQEIRRSTLRSEDKLARLEELYKEVGAELPGERDFEVANDVFHKEIDEIAEFVSTTRFRRPVLR